MPITASSSFTANCLLHRLEIVIFTITRHPRYDRDDPRNSHYTLHSLSDFVRRTYIQLKQIDFQKLDDGDDEATTAFDDIIGRTCMAHAMLTDRSGVMISRIMGASTTPIDLGDDIREMGALLMPDPQTGEFTKDPLDQKKITRVDLSDLLGRSQISDSEGEWEEGADDSDWEDMGPDVPPEDRSLFLELPREIRDQVYKYLLCADYTKVQPTGIIYQKPCRFEWRLQMAIMRTNKQIHKEAGEVLGRENKFVVIERNTDRLKQSVNEKQDGGDCDMPDPPIWLGRAKSQVSVVGEVMRINFSRADGEEQDKLTDYFVFLVEELRDFFVNLGKFRTQGVFRTKGLTCTVTLSPLKQKESKAAQKRRESALLDPLTKLRQLSNVTITGASDATSQNTIQQMKRKSFSAADVLQTIDGILGTVDAYAQMENHSVAVSYCDWCMYILSFYDASNAQQLDENMVGDIPDSIFETEDQQISMCAAMFRISLKRGLSCIQADALEDAYESADSALRLATMITSMPSFRDFPGGVKGGTVKRGPLIEWTTKAIVAQISDSGNSNRISAVDVARAYWYRALAVSCLEGPNQKEETDRMFAISLCNYVKREDVTNEICTLDLDLHDRLEESERRGENMLNSPHSKKKHFKNNPKLRDLPSYNRLWQRPLPPPVKSKNEVTDGGVSYMLGGEFPGMRPPRVQVQLPLNFNPQ